MTPHQDRLIEAGPVAGHNHFMITLSIWSSANQVYLFTCNRKKNNGNKELLRHKLWFQLRSTTHIQIYWYSLVAQHQSNVGSTTRHRTHVALMLRDDGYFKLIYQPGVCLNVDIMTPKNLQSFLSLQIFLSLNRFEKVIELAPRFLIKGVKIVLSKSKYGHS